MNRNLIAGVGVGLAITGAAALLIGPSGVVMIIMVVLTTFLIKRVKEGRN